jgi:hypothetical protein
VETVTVAVVTHRPSLRAALQRWVPGCHVAEVDDPEQLVHLTARGAILLIDLEPDERAAWLRALRRDGLDPPVVLLLDDEETDLEAPMGLGRRPVLFLERSCGGAALREALAIAARHDDRQDAVTDPVVGVGRQARRSPDQGSSTLLGGASADTPALRQDASIEPLVRTHEVTTAWTLLDELSQLIGDGLGTVFLADAEPSLTPVAAVGVTVGQLPRRLDVSERLLLRLHRRGGPLAVELDRLGAAEGATLPPYGAVAWLPAEAGPRGVVLLARATPFTHPELGVLADRVARRAHLLAVTASLGGAAIDVTPPSARARADAATADAVGYHARPSDGQDDAGLAPRLLHAAARGLQKAGLTPSVRLGAAVVDGPVLRAAWDTVDGLAGLTEGGGAVLALPGTGGFLVPTAGIGVEPAEAATAIPLTHPLIERVRAAGGGLRLRPNEPPSRGIDPVEAATWFAGIPLAEHASLLAICLGDVAVPSGLLLLGRSRRWYSAHVDAVVRYLGTVDGLTPDMGAPSERIVVVPEPVHARTGEVEMVTASAEPGAETPAEPTLQLELLLDGIDVDHGGPPSVTADVDSGGPPLERLGSARDVASPEEPSGSPAQDDDAGPAVDVDDEAPRSHGESEPDEQGEDPGEAAVGVTLEAPEPDPSAPLDEAGGQQDVEDAADEQLVPAAVADAPAPDEEVDVEPVAAHDPAADPGADDEPVVAHASFADQRADDEPVLPGVPAAGQEADDERVRADGPIADQEVEHEPVVTDEPDGDDEPVVTDEPDLADVKAADRGADVEPVLAGVPAADPEADDEPAVADVPAADPGADDESVAADGPIPDREADHDPLLTDDPEADDDPVVTDEPAADRGADDEPVVADDPAADPEQVLAGVPAADQEPDHEPVVGDVAAADQEMDADPTVAPVAPPRAPLVRTEAVTCAWILLDEVRSAYLDGAAVVLLRGTDRTFVTVAGANIDPYEGLRHLPFRHELVAALVRRVGAPIVAEVARADATLADVPLSNWPWLVAVPLLGHDGPSGVLLVGRSVPFTDLEVEWLEGRVRDVPRLLERARSVRAEAVRAVQLRAADEPDEVPTTGDEDRASERIEDGGDLGATAQAVLGRLRGFAGRVRGRMQAPAPAPAAPPPARPAEAAVSEAVDSSWSWLAALKHLIADGGAVVALRSSGGFFTTTAGVGVVPEVGAIAIPVDHPLVERLAASGGVVAVPGDGDGTAPPDAPWLAGIPLRERPSLLAAAIGDPADADGVLIIGRTRAARPRDLERLRDVLRTSAGDQAWLGTWPTRDDGSVSRDG